MADVQVMSVECEKRSVQHAWSFCCQSGGYLHGESMFVPAVKTWVLVGVNSCRYYLYCLLLTVGKETIDYLMLLWLQGGELWLQDYLIVSRLSVVQG